MTEVFAIRYARSTAPKASYFYGPGDPAPTPMDFFFWLIRTGDRSILVDAGFTPQVGARRGKEMIGDPADTLARLGAPPAEIGDVVLTHLHYDHCGLLPLFPNARIWLQQAEMAFWTGPYAGRGPFRAVIEPADIARVLELNQAGRITWLDGDATIAPGVTAHLVGGHSAGLQVVRVETGAGPLVLASDASHFYEHVEADRPSSVVHSLPDMLRAFDRLRELAGPGGAIVPGHDPEVLACYPAVPGLEDVVARLSD